MKSLSTMSITAEMEKEDKIRELENVVDDQRAVIQNQSQRIHELEVVVQEIGNNNNVNNMNGGVYKNGTDDYGHARRIEALGPIESHRTSR